jgi:hypothetical protein
MKKKRITVRKWKRSIIRTRKRRKDVKENNVMK